MGIAYLAVASQELAEAVASYDEKGFGMGDKFLFLLCPPFCERNLQNSFHKLAKVDHSGFAKT